MCFLSRCKGSALNSNPIPDGRLGKYSRAPRRTYCSDEFRDRGWLARIILHGSY